MKLNIVATVILRTVGPLASYRERIKRLVAYSNTLEYSSLRAAKNWIRMSRQPSGNDTRESTKEPLKLTLHMEAEQAPPIRTICQFL